MPEINTGGKGIRLFKASKELNVSVDTLISHLRSKKFDLTDTGPNAKLSEEMYQELLRAFAKDREAAVRHEKRVQEILARQDELRDVPEPTRPEPVAQPLPVEPTPPEPVFRAPVVEPPAPRPVSVPEPAPEPPAPPAPAPVEEPEPVVVARAEPAVEPAAVEAPSPAAREAAPPEPVVESVAPAPAEPEPVEAVAAAPEAAPVEAVPAAPAESVLLTADRYRLEGPKVVGKINLAAVEEGAARKKRKRKRKGKEDGAPATPSTETAARPATTPAAGETSEDAKRKRKKRRLPKVDEAEVQQMVSETMREMDRGASRTRQRRRRLRREERAAERQREEEAVAADSSILRVLEFVSTGELANLMNVPVTEVIKACLEMGMMVSINQRLDADTITLIADEFGFEVEFIRELGAEDIRIEEDRPEDLEPRAPVVTIMGHVDHGKTSLLDYIRSSNIVRGESGGITQHIGAYSVTLPDGRIITFLDTPGHEAFTAMRARGAQATDIVILVVAADDAVMPQTIEAINHAKAAGVPIVVAINKIDKPDANTARVMQQLADQGVLVEQYGGKAQCALVSAKTGTGVDELLEKVLLESDLLELRANPERNAVGVVIESRLDKGRGVVATVLVQNGTLRVGDSFVAGVYSGKVRAMFDERDKRVDQAIPATPALVLGFDGSPEVGDMFVVFDEEREAKEISQKRQQIRREQSMRQRKHISLDDISRRMALGNFAELNLIVKADVGGSVEALSDSLQKLSSEEVKLNIIHSGVGAITESDIMLASASDAVIIGFQVRPVAGVRKLAEHEEIDIRLYSIIYDAIEDVRDALEGLLTPEETEKTLGVAEVRETFKVPRVGTIAGCAVVEGKIRRSDRIRLVREGVVIYTGRMSSLKRFKDDVREVASGYECGIGIENYNDLKVGDQIEAFEIVETKRKLEV